MKRLACLCLISGLLLAGDGNGIRLRFLHQTDHLFSSEADHRFSPETDQCSPVKAISVLR